MLARAAEEEARASRGRLKLFFGASPGVGKTYAMLEEAQALRRKGHDVAVGWIETHGRAETEALAKGLERVAPKVIEHRGISIREMDLDAVLARRPSLALVDELAHTNAPGSRHARRWQDVQELLAAGIDVFTTLNVQHVESLHDIVAQITGVAVRETVPDRVLDRADEIELVDLPPDELLRRLEEGKVYVPDQARRAMESFFQKGNLIALRELALRRTAERVDVQAEEWRRSHGVRGPWGARERVLVAVGPAPKSADVVRAAARIAKGLKAPWIALSVETPQFAWMPDADRARVAEHLTLAESLGAETLVVRGDRTGDEILAVARRRDVTRIVVGKPAPRGFLARRRKNLVDWLVRGSGAIDVHVTSGVPGPEAGTPPSRPSGLAIRSGAFWSLVAVAGATALCLATRAWLEVADQAMIYLLAVLAVAARFSRRDAAVTAVVSVLALDFFFVPPYYQFAVSDLRYLITFGMLLVTGLVVSHYATTVRAQGLLARARERRTAALLGMSRALAASVEPAGIAAIVAREVGQALDVDATVFRLGERDALAAAGGGDAPFASSERERAVARWVLDHGLAAGRGTATLPASDALHVPLAGPGGVQGVLAVAPRRRDRALSPWERQTVDAFAALAASALERASLATDAEHARLAVETERTRSTLLAAVSHDLRTPLASIMGAAGGLLDEEAPLRDADRRALLASIRDEAKRLGRLVADLLELTRIESEGFVLQKDWYPLEEVIASAMDRLRGRFAGRKVSLDLPQDVLLLEIDGVLLEQVVLNLLENALKHTPEGTPIDVRVALEPTQAVVEVLDRGPGIPEGEEERIFERFQRLSGSREVEGAGLGLALCRAIVRAHGGEIGVEARPGGGSVFRFTLPRGPVATACDPHAAAEPRP